MKYPLQKDKECKTEKDKVKPDQLVPVFTSEPKAIVIKELFNKAPKYYIKFIFSV